MCVGVLAQSIPVYAENSNGLPDDTVVTDIVSEEGEAEDSVAEFLETQEIQESESQNWEEEIAQETDDSQKAKIETDDLPKSENVLESENEEESSETEEDSASVENDIEGTNFSAVYEEGKIKISNIRQLQAIGSGAALTDQDNIEETFGKGIPVEIDGGTITYGMDSQYLLTEDILLDSQAVWQLPAGFTGAFSGEPADETAPLYDKETDTIYIYNNYQLMTIASENSEQEPVMSKDMIPSEFGMGQLIYKDGTPSDESAEAAQEYLTYSKDHNYVLSQNFTEQMPELAAETLADGEHAYGRSYEGQVIYKDENGIEYILIGNKTQLEAIGKKNSSGEYIEVTGAAYSYAVIGSKFTLEYCGDADLDWSDKNNNGQLLDGGHTGWYGVQESTGEPSFVLPSTIGGHVTGKNIHRMKIILFFVILI